MPLPSPILDDRSYDQLRDELIRRIPAYAPEWTDHNPSDPGIALLELFAFLGENLLYRFNQIPEATRLAFLRLLQIPLRPPQPARALVVMQTDVAEALAAGDENLVAQGTEVRAGQIAFETQTEVRVLPVSVLGVCRAAVEPPDEDAEPEVFEFFQRAIDAIDGMRADEEAACYQNVLVSEDGSGEAVDLGQAVDGMLWLAVLAPDADTRDDVHASLAGSGGTGVILNIGFIPDLAPPRAADVAPCPGPGPDTGVTTGAIEWWISAGGRLTGQDTPEYHPLDVVSDTTAGLQRDGVIRLRLPAHPVDFGHFDPDEPDRAGTGLLPPVLDVDREARLVCWLRVHRHDRGNLLSKVRYVGANAAEVVQSQSVHAELLGAGTGQPGQTFRLLHAPVLPDSLVLEIEEQDGWVAWQEVDGFFASDDESRHFMLDREAGEIRFGNGLQGHAPPFGARVRARTYRHGGGTRGNVPAGAIAKLPGKERIAVHNPLPAHGGADGETVDQALDRIPGELRRRDRAVTLDDFRELARMTPGVDVARAECLPRFHAHTGRQDAAGVVTVVVWPRTDARHPGAPLPDRHMLEAVCRWLDERRLVTTELMVVPPRYRKIAVSVGLRVEPGHGIETVRRWAERILRQLLAPLPPFGPTGNGWPLGRRVHGPELEAAVLQVDGVAYIEGLEVAGFDDATQSWSPGPVELARDEVPELAEITVVEGAPLAPGQAVGIPRPEKVPVPIPVVREEC